MIHGKSILFPARFVKENVYFHAYFHLTIKQTRIPCPPARSVDGVVRIWKYLAEEEGFEPPWACTQTVFKTAAL